MLENDLETEKALTASDAACFNSHSIHAQQVSDTVREQNLVKVVSGRRANGETVLTCTSFGRLDPAGGIVDGYLNTADGLSTVYLTDYIEFEAGETYTIFEDIEGKLPSGKKEDQVFIFDPVDEKPIRLNVAFPETDVISGERVIFVLFG